MIAHAGGVPVEELLPALMSGGGAFLVLRLTTFGARWRQGRRADRTDDGAGR